MSAPNSANPYQPPQTPSSAAASSSNPKIMLWSGYVVSALPVLGLLMSAAMKFTKNEELVKGLEKFGWSIDLAPTLGVVELICTILYIIPQTSVLGAILLTGYLGGATATHVRVNDNFAAPIIIGVLLWLGLFLRDPRLRALIPLRR